MDGGSPMEGGVDRGTFRSAMARLGAAVSVVTSDGVAGICGTTVTAVSSVTDTPATLLVCINRQGYANRVIKENGVLCINVLAGDDVATADLIRARDVEKARALVEEAGLAGLTIDLAMYQDMATALILAENAKEIGITINPVQLDGATFYGEEYFTRNFFGGDYYPNNPFFVISALCDGPSPSLDQVRWRDADYHKLWVEASGTLDPALRKANLHKMQEILFDRGGFLIPAFGNELAAAAVALGGLPDHDVTGGGIFRALRSIGFKAA